MSTIPNQERMVDPFASFNSNVVNKLTQAVSYGDDGVIAYNDLQVVPHVDPLTVTVEPGYIIKDDVVIEITSSHDVDLNDPANYSDSNALSGNGNYYIVFDYSFSRSRPAPQAQIKVLRPNERSAYVSGMNLALLKVVKIDGDPAYYIDELLDYDDEVGYTDNQRQFLRTFVGSKGFMDSHSTENQSQIVYDSYTDNVYFGLSDRWASLGALRTVTLNAGASWLVSGSSYYQDIPIVGPNCILEIVDDADDMKIEPEDIEFQTTYIRVFMPVNTQTLHVTISY